MKLVIALCSIALAFSLVNAKIEVRQNQDEDEGRRILSGDAPVPVENYDSPAAANQNRKLMVRRIDDQNEDLTTNRKFTKNNLRHHLYTNQRAKRKDAFGIGKINRGKIGSFDWQPKIPNFFNQVEEEMKQMKQKFETLYSPAYEITESDGNYTITMKVAGYDKEDLTVELKGNMLSVSGEMSESMSEDGETSTEQKRFEKAFSVGRNIDASAITADLVDGELTVVVPKNTGNSPKRWQKRSKKVETIAIN